MSARRDLSDAGAMASQWRRRRMCILVADAPAPAALRAVSGHGAFVETHLRPALGSAVSLYHPEAGTIQATVVACEAGGIRLAFEADETAVAFALAAITADMSRPG